MKVLWVTNQPIVQLREILNLPIAQSGSWMETAYASIKDSIDLKLAIATIYSGDNLLHEVDNGHHFYAVPSKQQIGNYDYKDEFNQSSWRKVVDDFNPDIVQIWGTEYALGLCVQKIAQNIPSVVYMQGQMAMIAKHYSDGISFFQQLRYSSVYEWLRGKCMWHRQKEYNQAAAREKEILRNARNVIVESRWCGDICKSIVPGTRVFQSLLPINPTFSRRKWQFEKCNKHTIFTVSGGYPIKGHHILFQAVAIVKKKYPDVRVLIPGAAALTPKSVRERIQRSTYDRFLNEIVRTNNLSENICFLGKLTPEEMADRLSQSHVFVMPSTIENHSSSLIEAMMVGVPTISSFVGGINHYYKDGVNGFFYRFDEPEHLAALIMNYFENDNLCYSISQQTNKEVADVRLNVDLKKDFERIYREILFSKS